MERIYIDHIQTNQDGTVEVGYHLDDEVPASHSRVFASYQIMLADGGRVCPSPDAALQLALAAWVGVDPTGSNQSLATEFRVEVDMTALVSVRRVLDL